MPCVLVIGATGDVGQGVVAALLQAGRQVLAVARQAQRLQALAQALGSPPALRTLTGSVASDAQAAAMLPTQPHVRELVIASVVNGASTRTQAHPAWVTAEEVGALATRLITHPGHYPHPIWRIARRDVSGEPVISPEGPTRIQGLHQPLEPH